MDTSSKSSIGEKIIEDLKKTTIELEKMRVQIALGKAEGRDLYEDSKKKFHKYVASLKTKVSGVSKNSNENIENFVAMLEHLQVQLALGKAETRDVFNDQKKKISAVLNDIDKFIKSDKTAAHAYVKLLVEIKKFKIKLDIISLRYQLKKIEAGQEYEKRKVQFSKEINDLKKRILKKEKDTASAKWAHFKDEITEAYSHLKKAVG